MNRRRTVGVTLKDESSKDAIGIGRGDTSLARWVHQGFKPLQGVTHHSED